MFRRIEEKLCSCGVRYLKTKAYQTCCSGCENERNKEYREKKKAERKAKMDEWRKSMNVPTEAQ